MKAFLMGENNKRKSLIFLKGTMLICTIMFLTLILSSCKVNDNGRTNLSTSIPASDIKIGRTYKGADGTFIKLVDSSKYVYLQDDSTWTQNEYDEQDTKPSKYYSFGYYTKNKNHVNFNWSQAENLSVNFSSIRDVKRNRQESIKKTSDSSNKKLKTYIVIKSESELVTETGAGDNVLKLYKSKMELPNSPDSLYREYGANN